MQQLLQGSVEACRVTHLFGSRDEVSLGDRHRLGASFPRASQLPAWDHHPKQAVVRLWPTDPAGISNRCAPVVEGVCRGGGSLVAGRQTGLPGKTSKEVKGENEVYL